jgi:hypothetical protein
MNVDRSVVDGTQPIDAMPTWMTTHRFGLAALLRAFDCA